MSTPEDFPEYRTPATGRDGGPERLPEPSDHGPGAAPRPANPGQLLGRVQDVERRQESVGHHESTTTTTILTFRLVDDTGSPVEVELRGLRLSGSVRDGDWVEVPRALGATGRIETATALNVTTGATVTTVLPPAHRVVRVVVIVVAIAILIGVIAVGVMIFRQFASFGTF